MLVSWKPPTSVMLAVPAGCSPGSSGCWAVKWAESCGGKQLRAGPVLPGAAVTTGCAIRDRGRAGSSPSRAIINSPLIICCVNHQWPGVNHAYETHPSPALMSAES